MNMSFLLYSVFKKNCNNQRIATLTYPCSLYTRVLFSLEEKHSDVEECTVIEMQFEIFRSLAAKYIKNIFTCPVNLFKRILSTCS